MPIRDGLKIVWIWQSAAELRTGEGSTTIYFEYTLQWKHGIPKQETAWERYSLISHENVRLFITATKTIIERR